MRRARDAPAEAARDRADVDDRRARPVGVHRVLLPGRDPLEHGVEHLAHAQDRVLVAPALAERRVDEGAAACADAQPERAEVAEHDLALGRLAEDAHVGHAAVARRGSASRPRSRGTRRPARRPTASSRSRRRRRRSCTSPRSRTPGVLQRAHGLDVAGERALHVRDAEAVDAPVALRTPAAGSPGCPASHGSRPGVRRVHVPVEHQRRPAARARPGAEHVRAAVLDLLPLHLEAAARRARRASARPSPARRR